MKHEILEQASLPKGKKMVKIRLIPDNDFERTAINQVAKYDANEEEAALINDYLTFCLGSNYSVMVANNVGKGIYTLTAHSNQHSGFGQ